MARSQKFVTVTIQNHEKGSPIGIGLQEERDHLIIYSIDHEGPAAILKVGMTVLSINNTDVRSLDLAVYLLKEAEGLVTILATDDNKKARPSSKQSSSTSIGSTQRGRDPHPREYDDSDDDSDDDDDDDSDVIDGRIRISDANTKEEARQLLQPCPPPGLAPGGIWGSYSFSGPETLRSAALDSLVFGEGAGLCGYLFNPEDEEPAYLVNGWVYEQDGRSIGLKMMTTFRPAKIEPVNKDGRQTHWQIRHA